jgi:PAS domain S-box-containing protein
VLSGFSLILISNFLFVAGFRPFGPHDPTLIVFPITTTLIWWAIFRVQVFRVVPMARTTIVDGMANGLIVVDEGGVIVDDNDAAAALFGYSGTATGQRLEAAIPPLAAAIENDLRDSTPDGRPAYLRKEITLSLPGGERLLDLFASPIADPGRAGIAWAIIATDIGEIRRVQAKITTQKMNLAVAEERDRLSRDLHDNLGQVLSFAVIQSDVVLKKLEEGDMARAELHLRRLREIVGKAHDDLRGFARGLRDLEFDELPFEDLIAREAELFAQYSGIKVSNGVAQGSAPVGLDNSMKKHLAQIAKEALNNVAKHAAATKVLIDLVPIDRGYAFSIEDDGVGIGPPDGRVGVGLRIIEERASSFGGRVEIGPANGKGTRIRVFFQASEKGPR